MESKSLDWFLYDRDLRHDRVNEKNHGLFSEVFKEDDFSASIIQTRPSWKPQDNTEEQRIHVGMDEMYQMDQTY